MVQALNRCQSLECVGILILFVTLTPFSQAEAAPQMSIYYASGYTLSNPQLLTGNYTYIYTAGDQASMCTLSIHAFDSFPYLKVAKLYSLSIKPSQGYTTADGMDELGNRVLTIHFQCAPDQKYSITLLEYMMNSEISFSIDPAKIGEYDRASLWYKTYTASAQYIESDNPEIVAASKRIVGNETNPYLQARKIFDFVRNIPFDYSLAVWNPATEGALYILKTGRGVCRHHAALFVALSRAAGIPAAEILGIWGDGGPINHSWVQFYLANYGWIPAEPTPTACVTRNGNTCFGGVGDVQHTPLMSVNYEYGVGDCRPCNDLVDVFANSTWNGPIVSDGFPINIVSQHDPTIQSMTATVAMDDANASIRSALADGRTEGIDNAKLLLSNASDAFSKGDYDSAISLSKQAQQAADLATRPQITSTVSVSSLTTATKPVSQTSMQGSSGTSGGGIPGFPFESIFVGLLIGVAVLAMFRRIRRHIVI